MQEKIQFLRKTRRFSEEFKRSVVHDFETGQLSVIQLGKLHQVSPQIIYRWIYKYSRHNKRGTRIVEMSKSSTEKLKAQQQKIAELERLLGQKQIKIEYLEKMIELAQEQYHIEIKKNSDTPQSGGSKNTSRN